MKIQNALVVALLLSVAGCASTLEPSTSSVAPASRLTNRPASVATAKFESPEAWAAYCASVSKAISAGAEKIDPETWLSLRRGRAECEKHGHQIAEGPRSG